MSRKVAPLRIAVITGYPYTDRAPSATRCEKQAGAVHLSTMLFAPKARFSAAIARVVVFFGFPSLVACAAPAVVPEPTVALAAYVDAVESGDAERIHGMMTAASQRSLSLEEVQRVLREQKDELREHAKRLSSKGELVSNRARLRFPDGEIVSLDAREGRFYVSAAAGLPAAARTPVEALGQLRTVLARRSYGGLLRVLTAEARAAVDDDIQSLVEGLGQPEALTIEVKGDRAKVVVPGGHRVKMRRHDGVWRVEDFD